MASEDEYIGRALRELRRRSGQTMEQAAEASSVSLRMWRRIEHDGAGSVPVNVVRRAFSEFEARARMSVWWKGAELDRVLDEAHAAVVERVVVALTQYGWMTAPEMTFSEYGERGSVDVLGFHAAACAGLVTEVKASWGSIEETNRSLHVKVRLGAKLVEERFGTRPKTVSRILILREDMTLRRVAARHAGTLSAVYPQRGREIRAWLRHPTGSISGLWFLSDRADSETR